MVLLFWILGDTTALVAPPIREVLLLLFRISELDFHTPQRVKKTTKQDRISNLIWRCCSFFRRHPSRVVGFAILGESYTPHWLLLRLFIRSGSNLSLLSSPFLAAFCMKSVQRTATTIRTVLLFKTYQQQSKWILINWMLNNNWNDTSLQQTDIDLQKLIEWLIRLDSFTKKGDRKTDT